MKHVNDWCFRGIYNGGLWEEDLQYSAYIFNIQSKLWTHTFSVKEPNRANTVLTATRSTINAFVLFGKRVRVVNKYEPRHDKTNKMSVRPAKTQISLGIRRV